MRSDLDNLVEEAGRVEEQQNKGWFDKLLDKCKPGGFCYSVICFLGVMLFLAFHFVMCVLSRLGVAKWEYYHGKRIKWWWQK
jgi:hypothetical protein